MSQLRSLKTFRNCAREHEPSSSQRVLGISTATCIDIIPTNRTKNFGKKKQPLCQPQRLYPRLTTEKIQIFTLDDTTNGHYKNQNACQQIRLANNHLGTTTESSLCEIIKYNKYIV